MAPERLPEHLVWFKWESYVTWLSGFAMLCIVYYAGADLFLVDRNVWTSPPGRRSSISLASLSVGWLLYDNLCKSQLAESPTTLMVLLFVILVVMAWGYTHVFTGRAALLHLGAFTATIMSANVFFIIIPNQTIVVADLNAGRTPDPKYGKIAKLRSTHNNYLTLPVLFLMLSNHYPLAFATEWNWLIASLVFLMGVTIRHYFNTMHATGKGAELDLGGDGDHLRHHHVAVVVADEPARGARRHVPDEQRFASAAGFTQVADTVIGRCSMCHTAEPAWPGVHRAPKGVILDNEPDIAAHAREIYLQAGRSHAMPPGNVTEMAPAERKAIIDWYTRRSPAEVGNRLRLRSLRFHQFAFRGGSGTPIIGPGGDPGTRAGKRGVVVDGADGRRPGKTAENWSRNDRIRAGAVSGPWRSAPRTETAPSPAVGPTPVEPAPELAATPPPHRDPVIERPPTPRVEVVRPVTGRHPHRTSRGAMFGWIGFGLVFAAGCVGLAFLFQPDAGAEPQGLSAPAETAGAGPGDVAAAAAGGPAAGALPEPTTITGITSVRLRTGTGFAEADRDAIVAALAKAGLSEVQVEPLPFAVANARVGYYRPEDRAASEALAAYVAPVLGFAAPIAVRDYGALLDDAEPGRLDLWVGD